MTAKEYLSQLREVKRQQRIIQEEIDELTIRAGYGTSRRVARNLSGTDHNCRMEDVILDPKNWTLRERCDKRQAELDAKEHEIMDVIYSVDEMVFQNILLLRYVRCLQWEQIAWKMNYSLDWAYHIHGKALLEVRVPKNEHGENS